MKVVYIAGPYRAPTERGVVENIRQAEGAALQVWRSGAVALCPHLNTAHFGGACPDEVWLVGDLELARRCDAVVCLPGWERSVRASDVAQLARQLKLPVFGYVCEWEDFLVWLLKESGT